jgi:hypothetical protein
LKDVLFKEIQPYFEKFICFFEEIIHNLEINLPNTTNSNVTLSTQASTTSSSPSIVSTQHNLSAVEAHKEWTLTSNSMYIHFMRNNKRAYLNMVNEVAKLIGISNKLYSFTIQQLAALYLKSHNWFYATLRNTLLIKLNEIHHNDLINTIVMSGSGDTLGESIFKFGLIINTCLKEKRMDSKRAKELETIMESKKFEKIIP